jgi:UDP:flavonoid glycosyltransferase YjiC (YdhE family)
MVYISPGSSGKLDLLYKALTAVKDLDVSVVAGTSDRTLLDAPPDNVFVAPYLPARDVLRRASLFISHGGSASAYVALAEGTPVLGIPSNMDQHLTMQYVEQAGAGKRLRSEQASPRRIRECVAQMSTDERLKQAAQNVARLFSKYDATKRFSSFLETHDCAVARSS